MNFIQNGFLIALGAIAIPIIIHLVFRQKAKRVDLGTLRFLRLRPARICPKLASS